PPLDQVIARIDAALGAPPFNRLSGIAADGVTLRYRDARAGREWTADDGRIAVTRAGGRLRLTGDVAVLGGAGLARLAVNAESGIGETALSFGMELSDLPARDIASQSPGLAVLAALDAPISGALRGVTTAEGALAGLDATLQIGAGALQPRPGARAIRFDGARAYFSYDPARERLIFTEISVESGAGSGRAEGVAVLEGVARGRPEALVAQVVLSDVSANPLDLFEAPLSLARAEADLRLRLDPFTIEIGRLQVTDGALLARASGRIAAERDGWRLALDATLPEASPEEVAARWPPQLAPRAREWFLQNVSAGQVHDGIFALRRAPGQDRPDLYLDFRFDGAEVRYGGPLPVMRQASGQFTLYDHRLGVAVTKGTVSPEMGGDLTVTGGSFTIPDTRERPARGQVRIEAEGSVTGVLSYLDAEPLRVMDRIGRSPDLASGRAQLSGRLGLPLKRGLTFGDIDMAFDGTATDVSSGDIVPGRELAAERLAVRVNPEQVEVTGRATLQGVPFDGAWRQPIGANAGPGRVEGRVTLSDAGARALGIALPQGLVSG
ncbi:DUF3971 domain-containing protein, partial [Litorisediminicola beolgyonensis]